MWPRVYDGSVKKNKVGLKYEAEQACGVVSKCGRVLTMVRFKKNKKLVWNIRPTCFKLGLKKSKKTYSTRYSHVVPHHSTDRARWGLTAEIGRDPVFSPLYGRKLKYQSRVSLCAFLTEQEKIKE